jgi:hypothetical protein
MPYHTYGELVSEFLKLESSYPGMVRHESAGKSVEGRDLLLFKIGTGSGKVLFTGSIHGNEHPGAELLLLYAKWLLERREAIASEILSKNLTLVLPVHNPDGFDPYRRQNSKCVDLNRNYPKGWGGSGSSPGVCSLTSRGFSALDQPESAAVNGVLLRERPKWHLDIHSGSEVLAYPWSYTQERPKDEEYFKEVCRKIDDLSAERGVRPYSWGQISWSNVDLAEEVRVPFYPLVIYVCSGTITDSAYDAGTFSMALEASASYNPSYDNLQSYYFPRMLPIAITISRECFGVPVDSWLYLALGTMPLWAVGAVVAGEELSKAR